MFACLVDLPVCSLRICVGAALALGPWPWLRGAGHPPRMAHWCGQAARARACACIDHAGVQSQLTSALPNNISRRITHLPWRLYPRRRPAHVEPLWVCWPLGVEECCQPWQSAFPPQCKVARPAGAQPGDAVAAHNHSLQAVLPGMSSIRPVHATCWLDLFKHVFHARQRAPAADFFPTPPQLHVPVHARCRRLRSQLVMPPSTNQPISASAASSLFTAAAASMPLL